MDPKKIVVVLGFPRSGTSVVTKGLQSLGVDLGRQLLKIDKHSKWNPTGFWEDKEISHIIHKEIYSILNYHNRQLFYADKTIFDHIMFSKVKLLAKTVLKNRFLNTDTWGFKDPQTAKILPFWQHIFEEENLDERYVIALRNPLASAISYAKLTRLETEICLLLWITHIVSAIEFTHHKSRIIVSYENLLKNPSHELIRMKNSIEISHQNNHQSFIEDFINNNLQRNFIADESLENSPLTAIAPICLDIYKLLKNAAHDHIALNSQAFLNQWQSIMHRFNELKPLIEYLDFIHENNLTLKNKLHRINKSIAIKLLYPLHWLDDTLRGIRMIRRKTRRIYEQE